MFTNYNQELEKIATRVIKMNKSYFLKDFSSDQLKDHQEKELRKTLNYVKKNSPFYKKSLKGISTDVIKDFKLENITDLPFTTKKDLREEMSNILSRPIEECSYYYETTGTTGRATPCPRDVVDIIHTNSAITSCFETVLNTSQSKHIVGVCGPTELHSFGDTLGDVCRNLGLSVAKFWPVSPLVGVKKSIELLQELKVTVLMCTPGMALTMTKYALENGYDLKKDFYLEILMVTGELSSPAMIKNLENIWGVKAYNFLYGSQETLALAAVANNSKLHTFPLNYIYEIVDPISLKTIDEGTEYVEGELVVSMLYQGAKPMIRYRTGDLARIYKSSYNLPFETIQILGRINDNLELNGVTISAYDFEQLIMENIPLTIGYQVIIDSKLGIDNLELNFEFIDKNGTKNFMKKLSSKLKKRFNIEVIINMIDLDAVTRTGAMTSWKDARIFDKRHMKKEHNYEK